MKTILRIFSIFTYRFWKTSFLYARGINLLMRRKYDHAIEEFKKALSTKIDHPFLMYSCNKYIGLSYYFKNEISQAKEFLIKANSLRKADENDSELFWGLGGVYDFEANLPEAKRFYELAVKSYKKCFHFTDIGYIKYRLNKIDEFNI